MTVRVAVWNSWKRGFESCRLKLMKTWLWELPFETRENMAVRVAVWWLAVCVCVMNKDCMCGTFSVCYTISQLLTEPTWLHLRSDSKLKKYFCWINLSRRLPMEIFAHGLCFQVSLHLCLVSPLTFHSSQQFQWKSTVEISPTDYSGNLFHSPPLCTADL